MDADRELAAKHNRFKLSLDAAIETLKQVATKHSAVAVIELINHSHYTKGQNILVVTDHDDIVIRYIAVKGPSHTIKEDSYEPGYK